MECKCGLMMSEGLSLEEGKLGGGCSVREVLWTDVLRKKTLVKEMKERGSVRCDVA